MGEVSGTPMKIRRYQVQLADLVEDGDGDGNTVAAVFTQPAGSIVVVLGVAEEEPYNDSTAGAVIATIGPAGTSQFVTVDTPFYVGMNGEPLTGDGTKGRSTLVVATSF